MRLTYDNVAKAAYVEVNAEGYVENTRTLYADGSVEILVDTDINGEVVGVEILA